MFSDISLTTSLGEDRPRGVDILPESDCRANLGKVQKLRSRSEKSPHLAKKLDLPAPLHKAGYWPFADDGICQVYNM